MYLLSQELWFPPVSKTHHSGILAVGGDLSSERLMLAYRNGIFPWFSKDDPILWWCPEERMVLFPNKLHISKSMRPYFNQNKFRVTHNECFEKVITECSRVKRKDQDGTWINNEMISAYLKLFELGFAKSIEVWDKNDLVGGLYGIFLEDKKIFCGESMFSKASNASKFGFIKMVNYYKNKGVKLVDCQVYTSHLESLGAQTIERDVFLTYLNL